MIIKSRKQPPATRRNYYRVISDWVEGRRDDVLLSWMAVLRMRPIVTDGVGWSLCRSVGRSVAIVSPAKTAEPIEMPFGLWTRVGPRKHVLDGSCTLTPPGEYD